MPSDQGMKYIDGLLERGYGYYRIWIAFWKSRVMLAVKTILLDRKVNRT